MSEEISLTIGSTWEKMEDIRKFIAQARRMARLQFEKSHPGHFLLGQVPDDWDDDMGFATGVRTVSEIDEILQGNEDELEPGYLLMKAAKTDRAAWLRWISVGRARNNDIILRHPSISKLHAQIHKETEGNEDKPAFKVIDAGSANGTFVNKKRLVKGEPCPLYPGDSVTFGDIECMFLNTGSLYENLRNLPREFEVAS